MKLFGMKDPLSKVLDNLEQDKGSTLGKTISVAIFDLTVYLLLFVILIIILPMLVPVIILVLLQKPALYLSIVLESLIPLLSGMVKKKNSSVFTNKGTHTAWDSGIPRSHKGWD